MSTALLLQILLPAALSFLAGHFHILLPNPLAGGSAPLPTGIGHGEIIAWLLSRLVSSQPTVPVAPVGPAPAPSNGAVVLQDVLGLLRQLLQAQAAQPAPLAPVSKPA